MSSIIIVSVFHSVFRGKINLAVTLIRNCGTGNMVEKSTMIKKILVAVIAALLTSAIPLAFAASACAETAIGPSSITTIDPNVTYHYDYTIENVTGMGLPRSGSLDLRFDKSGIVSGYYNPGVGLSYIPVTGGLEGNSLWLDLGARTERLLHVNATLNSDGTIAGNAFRDRSTAEYSFDATLAKS